MVYTTTLTPNLALGLSNSDPNRISDALREYGIGLHLSPQKWTWLGTTGATAVNITTAAFVAGASAGANTPPLPLGVLTLPGALLVGTLRVTTGASGSVALYDVTDSGGTARLGALLSSSTGSSGQTKGVALISDDGSTITFPAQVSGFVLQYVPRSLVDVNSTLF